MTPLLLGDDRGAQMCASTRVVKPHLTSLAERQICPATNTYQTQGLSLISCKAGMTSWPSS